MSISSADSKKPHTRERETATMTDREFAERGVHAQDAGPYGGFPNRWARTRYVSVPLATMMFVNVGWYS